MARVGKKVLVVRKALSAAFWHFDRNSFGFCRKKQSNFGISSERAVSAFGTKKLFFEASLYKGDGLKGVGLEGGWPISQKS